MKYVLLGLLAMVGCQSPEVSKPDRRTIHVVGIGKVKTLPDQVEITIKTEFTRPAMRDAVQEAQATMDEVLKVAKTYVKDPTDIKTSTIASNKDYEYDGRRQVFKGYQASQAVDITLRDLSRFEAFTAEILATKVTGIEKFMFSNSKADSILREVDLLAIDDARNTARKICERTGVKLGKIVRISNYGPEEDDVMSVDRPMSGRGRIGLYGKGIGGRGFQISPEILTYSKAAYVTYEIGKENP